MSERRFDPNHMIYAKTLRHANAMRQYQWDPDKKISPLYRAVEFAGEAGEACNKVKKLEREKLGLPGSRATKEELADELADVLITADLIAMEYDIDLVKAVRRKFNQTSEKQGFTVHLLEER
jgi:NTP pyrophosphatase (non-canonical NTP hydrolase)